MSSPIASTEAPRSTVEFHITGFGEFDGVKNNPTEQLIGSLPSFLSAHPLPPAVSVASLTVLETSAVGARDKLHQLRQAAATATSTASKSEESQSAPVAPACHRVWLHFGVHAKSEDFKLESTAYNVADFRCADQRGWKPQQEPILTAGESDANGTCPAAPAAELCSGLDVSGLCSALAGSGWKVCVSTDPGRFVCNWTFYHSLHECNAQRDLQRRSACVEHALFVHVPPHDVYGLEEQQKFAREVIVQIAKSLQRAELPAVAGDTAAAATAAATPAAATTNASS